MGVIGQGEQNQRVPQPPTIIIEMTPEGLSVKGTSVLANPVLCYGMLEAAKDVIRRGNEERNRSRIEVAQMVPPAGITLP